MCGMIDWNNVQLCFFQAAFENMDMTLFGTIDGGVWKVFLMAEALNFVPYYALKKLEKLILQITKPLEIFKSTEKLICIFISR